MDFERIRDRKDSRRKVELQKFHERLGSLTFFDPACGCGNFLIIAYRELRLLEMEVIRETINYERDQYGQFSGRLDVAALSRINVDQFYGLEVGEFPARIAETAMWMMDHIMNNLLSFEFGQSYARIPLVHSPHIVVDNALERDWSKVISPDRCSYLFGNPPFRGHQYRTPEQQQDMERVWGVQGQVNRLDYVSCWFNRAVAYTQANKAIDVAFVSTNSITQGEQAGILWPYMFRSGISIHFAHRTFQWNNEARGKAAVHCVIIGLTWDAAKPKTIFEYDHVRGDPHASPVNRINGYLFDGPQYSVPARSKPPTGRHKMHKGSQPTDGARLKNPKGGYITTSNLILDSGQKAELLSREPSTAKWLKPFVGGDELISGDWRWCLWLKDADPTEIRQSTAVQERLERVKKGRLQSPTASVKAFARFPTLFTQDRQPSIDYLGIPEVSSETREYIPMTMLSPGVIASNKLQIIPGATLLDFGILTSAMHMAWMRTVGGRLKSDYSYSPSIYNSFPWPDMTDKQRSAVEQRAQAILDKRAKFKGKNLDDLYDVDSMPPELRKAHDDLDRTVDRLYRKSGFRFERERIELLFGLFETSAMSLKLTGGQETAKETRKTKVRVRGNR